jgi:hypothetical protein
VKHLQSRGFQVEAKDVPQSQLTAISMQGGVTDDLTSCHTAKIGNYTIEGHVPAEDIQRLLKEKPAGVIGLSAPGMPAGSPGMEGGRAQPYDVIAFTKDGKKTVFATHK